MVRQYLTVVGVLLIAATVQAQEASQPKPKPFIDLKDPAVIELAIGRTFDAVGTHYAIDRGAHERILTQNPWTNDAISAGLAVFEMYLVSRLPAGKVRSVLAYTVGGFHVYVGVRNLHEGRKSVPY